MKPLNRALLAMAVSWIALAPSTGFAQVGWLNPEGKLGVQLEFSTGSFKKEFYPGLSRQFTFPTSSTFLTGYARLGKNFHGIVELPLFNTKFEVIDLYYQNYYGSIYKKFGIANPYFGIELGGKGTSTLWSIGVRLPIISRENMAWWVSSPPQYISSHRFLAYLNKVIQISTNLGFRHMSSSGLGVRIAGGTQFGLPNKGDAEMYGDLATNIWYQTPRIRMMGAISGLVLITESNVDFSDRLLMTVGVAGDLKFGSWESGVHFQLPIDNNLTDRIKTIYGLHLSYLFPPAIK
jgi:hypothetical protein